MIPGAIIAGGASLLGDVFQGVQQGKNIQQQENFQAQMSNTAFQRSDVDMTKAGLNPALMYGSGGAESSPSGAIMNPPNMGDSVDKALQGLTVSKSMDVQDSVITKNAADAASTMAGIPVKNLEGEFAKTGSDVFHRVATLLQGLGDHKAKPGDVGRPPNRLVDNADNLNQSGASKAGNGTNGVGSSFGADPFTGQ